MMQVLQQMAAALSHPIPEDVQLLAASEAVQKLPHALCLSLLLTSLDEWQAAALPILQRTICHALHVRCCLTLLNHLWKMIAIQFDSLTSATLFALGQVLVCAR